MKIITVGRSAEGRSMHRNVPLYLWAIKTYEVRYSPRSKKWTWLFVGEQGLKWGRWPSDKMYKEAEVLAKEKGICFCRGVRHGTKADFSPLELLVLTAKGDVEK